MPLSKYKEPPYIDNPTLYEYLLELHQHVYGLGTDITGILDKDNLSVDFPSLADDEEVTGEWTFTTHPLGLDHTKIANIGTNTHAGIDLHIGNTTVHFLDPVPAHVLEADPHLGYRLESTDHTHQSTGLQAGQLDHGLAMTATSLLDDDHPQYKRLWRTFLLMGA